MKFKYIQEFYLFLQEAENIGQIKDFREINLGGSSYNFYLKSDSGEFLIKLVPNNTNQEEHFQKLKKTWESCSKIFPLKQEDFKNYKLLMLPFFPGRKLTYKDCSPEVIQSISKAYSQLLKSTLPAECISKPLDFKKMKMEIEEWLADKSFVMNRFIKYFFWQKFKKELKLQHQNYQLIHGDFTVNNILIDKNNEIHVIDYECFRQGYDYEDWGSLFLQLSGYKGFFGSLKKLLYLLDEWKKNNKTKEIENNIIQAVQIFYLKTLYNRLANPNKRQLRKDFNLLFSLCQYFTLVRKLKLRFCKKGD